MRLMYIAFLLLIAVKSFFAQYILESYVIDGGGLSKTTSNGYILGGSISQTFVAKNTNSNHEAYIGYWTPRNAPPGIEELDHNRELERSIAFALNQNYPNPVSHSTIIEYSIPKCCEVELLLYDVTGKRIMVLMKESQLAGYYKVKWNIQNVLLKEVANGVYFYQLNAGDFSMTRKMVILR